MGLRDRYIRFNVSLDIDTDTLVRQLEEQGYKCVEFRTDTSRTHICNSKYVTLVVESSLASVSKCREVATIDDVAICNAFEDIESRFRLGSRTVRVLSILKRILDTVARRTNSEYVNKVFNIVKDVYSKIHSNELLRVRFRYDSCTVELCEPSVSNITVAVVVDTDNLDVVHEELCKLVKVLNGGNVNSIYSILVRPM